MLDVTVAGSLEELAALLVQELQRPVDDPLVPEWIVVPTAGVQQWLQLRLAEDLGASSARAGDGVAANFSFARPGTMLRLLLAGGLDRPDDPWEVEQLTWTVLGARGHAPELGIPDLPGKASVFTWAHRIADRFDRYHLHRPEMVRVWAKGHDLDADGIRLPATQLWQPKLWRWTRSTIGSPSPPEVAVDAFDPNASGLPHRLTLFGFSALPGGVALTDLLAAYAAGHEVRVSLVDPSPTTTWTVARHLRGIADRPANRFEAEAAAEQMVDHRLLRSWGGSSREATASLATWRVVGSSSPVEPTLVDPPEDVPDTLLQALQRSIRHGGPPDASFVPTDADQSIRIHSGHTDVRQLEILRDAILHLLADDPSLSEDDILVNCPDLGRFEPLIHAVFGAPVGGHPDREDPSSSPRVPGLRCRVVRSGGASEHSGAHALCTLLDLLASPCDLAEVLTFCGLEPVRRRFGLDEGSVADLAGWAEQLNVRWGLDPSHRADFGMPGDLESNTWRRALDRLLIGVAVADGDGVVVDGMAPHGVEGTDVETVGACSEIVSRLADLVDEVRVDRPIGAWLDLVQTASDAFLAFDPDGRQGELVDRTLARMRSAAAGSAAATVDLSFPDVRHAVANGFGAAGGRGRFFGGGVTVTSLGPSRWMPYRVVCLLGLDQDALVTAPTDGDDLVAASPRLGDPDRRADQRQALLEAVLAAGDHLVIVRRGREAASNDVTPEAVVVTELRTAIGAVLDPTRRDEILKTLETAHPLHATDVRNFTPGALGHGGPWSFDPTAAAGALARAGTTSDARGLPMGAPDDPSDATASFVDLNDLCRFLENPSRTFCEQGLRIRLPEAPTSSDVGLPVRLSSLDRWKLISRLVDTTLQGGDVDPERMRRAVQDDLPVGALGQDAFDEARVVATALVEGRRALIGDATAAARAVDVVVRDDARLVGSVDVITEAGQHGVFSVTPSRPHAHDDLTAWVRLLALTAVEPTIRWTHTNMRWQKEVQVRRLALRPGAPDVLDVLGELIDLQREGRRHAQAFFPELSRDLARPVDDQLDGPDHKKAWSRAAKTWDAMQSSTFGRDRFVQYLYRGWSFAALEASGQLESLAEDIWHRFDETVEVLS